MKSQFTEKGEQIIADISKQIGVENSQPLTVKFHEGKSKLRWIYDKEEGILIINTTKIPKLI
jgi:hypothetical protein